jgi:HAE1 family hydrophobic/amphiphilic exporter-1
VFLSDLSIKRPVAAAVVMLALVVLGLFSYRRLALDLYPDVEIPVIMIVTTFPGASPESVEREVTKRVEDAVNPIAGVKHVTSSSVEGISTVVVQFQLEVRINEASQDARARINAIRGDLPEGIEEPIIRKLDFSAMPVVSFAVKSDRLSPRELSTFVEKKVKRRLENISGVGKVDLSGLSKREVSIEVDPSRLEGLGMGVDELVAGVKSENVNTPVGRLDAAGSEVPLRISGKPVEVERFRSMAVSGRAGRPVLLGEVATVSDSVEERRTLAYVNGVPAVGVDIQRQSGANTVDVVDRAKAAMEKMRPEMPPGTEVTVVRDASQFIRESVADVRESMVIGGLLTVFIVFCFLNSWRSTVITGLTLPISVISSFVAMYFLGMTLNVLTLMALSLAIGLLIDDAIVVRENIVRHLEMGKDHVRASREGTSEIGQAVIATTLSIVAVFVPVAFMKGIVGRFFYSFGITVTFAVLVSLFVSFTLDPMLSSRWVDPDIERKGRRHFVARLLDRFNDAFDRAADRYRSVIGWALDHRKSVVALAFGAFAGGLLLMSTLESNFFPLYDRGEFQVYFKTSPGSSIAETRDRLDLLMKGIVAVPGVEHVYATVGANDTTVRDGSIYVKLVERERRTADQFEIQRKVRALLESTPGVQGAVSMAGGESGTTRQLMVNLKGDDIPTLKKYGALLKDEFYRIPGIVDLEVSLEQDLPEFRLVVDREKARNLGIRTADLVTAVAALVGGQAVSTYEDEDGDAVDVRVRLPAKLRENPSQVLGLRLAVRQADGTAALVPIGSVARYEMRSSPSAIDRQDLSRQVVISANLDGVPIGTAVKAAAAAGERVKLPPGYRLGFSGEAEDMAESFRYMAEALFLAVVFVYLILAAQFESFVDPLSIMLSLPLSLVGMAGMLFLTRDTISIMSLIGLIMLMGLVTKNAILLVDYAKRLRGEGMERREAVILAGRTRLRPILMTSAAMIFGMLPLATGMGAGGEFRAPMARAVVGGLLTSTVLTLLVVPTVYTVLDDGVAWIRGRRGKRHDTGKEGEVTA